MANYWNPNTDWGVSARYCVVAVSNGLGIIYLTPR